MMDARLDHECRIGAKFEKFVDKGVILLPRAIMQRRAALTVAPAVEKFGMAERAFGMEHHDWLVKASEDLANLALIP